MKRKVEYTEIITNQCGDEIFEIICGGGRICIREDDVARIHYTSLERHEFDQLVAAVAKYDAMVAIATPNGAADER